MTKNTFKIGHDGTTNLHYIYQNEDEADKNHSASDTSIANQGRIYEIPGTENFCYQNKCLLYWQ